MPNLVMNLVITKFGDKFVTKFVTKYPGGPIWNMFLLFCSCSVAVRFCRLTLSFRSKEQTEIGVWESISKSFHLLFSQTAKSLLADCLVLLFTIASDHPSTFPRSCHPQCRRPPVQWKQRVFVGKFSESPNLVTNMSPYLGTNSASQQIWWQIFHQTWW